VRVFRRRNRTRVQGNCKRLMFKGAYICKVARRFSSGCEKSTRDAREISESYDCVPEKVSVSNQPGERIILLSKPQRRSIVRPEPRDEEYPKDEKKKTF
jgi:hypothetical protein